MSLAFIVGVAIVLLIALIIYGIKIFNDVNKSDMKCQQAESGIDVALTKRYDLLTKLLAAAKQYAEFEKSTILETINLRSDSSISEKMAQSVKLDEAQTTLFGLAENYPDLKTSENYLALQNGIQDSEDQLQAARRAYNQCVDMLNNYFITFPASIIAGMTGKRQRSFFEADETHKKDVVIN